LEEARRRYRQERRGVRRGQMARAFPAHLAMDIPPFGEWLHEYVRRALDCNEPLNEDIICLSQPPSRIVQSYASMWAYGNHYRVEGEIGNCHMTYDSGIACNFIQGSRSSARDRNVITTNLYYVGILKEILVVSYATMKRILFRASWIPSNLRGVQTIRQDQYGFWLVNYARRLPEHSQPYVFPSTVSQVK